jgi:diaminohydroxyphosphoribosylaminopyrimidine deaminase/5-amino-6-(5-phosphoribosylamino)uracil reductase
MTEHYFFMQRCLQLAAEGEGYTAPNPMVGCVVVHQNRIIGEGYHRKFGEPHAEVNAINSVKNKELLPDSTLYVSLEPCNHFGKTPPCTELIIKSKIPSVVTGCRDPFTPAKMKGIEALMENGISVTAGVMEKECRELNKRFLTFHEQKRPFVFLKWAQSSDGFIGYENKRIVISNPVSQRIVHKWRSREQSILVGTNTALTDDPALNNRKWFGPHPLKIVLDRNLRLPKTLKIFNSPGETIILNGKMDLDTGNIIYIKVDFKEQMIPQLLHLLYSRNILSVMVEGGAAVLNSFICGNAWDEAAVLTDSKVLGSGIKAPAFDAVPFQNETTGSTSISLFRNPKPFAS